MRSQRVVGMLPSVVCLEFFHLALRGLYQGALPDYRLALAADVAVKRRFAWEDLYKLRPDLIEQFLPELESLLPRFEINRLAVIRPAETSSFMLKYRFEGELLERVGRYQLNTNDAAILMEAQRAGISSIATLDADMCRAALDFDVYTWL
ncbi:MAG: hypothetical protein ACRDJH_08685 [Thermomicrobiales bacterium]